MFVEGNSIYSMFGYKLIVNMEIEKACFRFLLKFIYLILIPKSIQHHVHCLEKFKVTLISFIPDTDIRKAYFEYIKGMRQFFYNCFYTL